MLLTVGQLTCSDAQVSWPNHVLTWPAPSRPGCPWMDRPGCPWMEQNGVRPQTPGRVMPSLPPGRSTRPGPALPSPHATDGCTHAADLTESLRVLAAGPDAKDHEQGDGGGEGFDRPHARMRTPDDQLDLPGDQCDQQDKPDDQDGDGDLGRGVVEGQPVVH